MEKTILVVDDDSLARKSLVGSLAEAGFRVEAAENGKAGLAKALEIKPDMVISDVRMPELDGLEMVEKLRQDDWGRQLPVIYLTTDEDTDTVNQAMAVGVTTYLSKTSLSPDQIAEQVQQLLQQ